MATAQTERSTPTYTSFLTRDTPCTQRLSEKSTHCEHQTRVFVIQREIRRMGQRKYLFGVNLQILLSRTQTMLAAAGQRHVVTGDSHRSGTETALPDSTSELERHSMSDFFFFPPTSAAPRVTQTLLRYCFLQSLKIPNHLIKCHLSG